MQVYKHLGDHEGIVEASFHDDADATIPFEPVIVMPAIKNGDLQRYLSMNDSDEHLQIQCIRSLAITLAFCSESMHGCRHWYQKLSPC